MATRLDELEGVIKKHKEEEAKKIARADAAYIKRMCRGKRNYYLLADPGYPYEKIRVTKKVYIENLLRDKQDKRDDYLLFDGC
jgi:hypothetical protein